MHKRSSRGFTLIELLVVIAIIGILAGIVLAALGSTRQQGADAGIQGNLDTIRTQAEVYAGGVGQNSYDVSAGTTATAASGSSCGTTGMWGDTTITQATKSASTNAGTPAAGLNGVTGAVALCKSSTSAWMFATVLKSDPLNTWCVDSTGKAKKSLVTALDSAAEVTPLTACP